MRTSTRCRSVSRSAYASNNPMTTVRSARVRVRPLGEEGDLCKVIILDSEYIIPQGRMEDPEESAHTPCRAQARAGTSRRSGVVARRAGRGFRAGREQALDERTGIERLQVLDPLAEPDQLHGQAELLCDRHDDPAPGGPVQLREHDPGDGQRRLELARLCDAVLPGRRVEHEERFNWR